jgi:3-hydroxyisobutyrate dehydrogenase-like beta-hydroxyacid dehydrogenase
MTTKIGMIGIGIMGHGIASNLLKHGHTLVMLEHAGNQPLETLLAAGGTTAKTPKAVAADADIVIICVTGTPQVEAVLMGSDGVISGMKAGAVVIDCSTALPTSTEKLAKLVNDAGGFFLDSPMTRTSKEAAEGRLNLLVGGDSTVFEQCRPILACFAENITHAGATGAGHRMKLIHNYVSLGMVSLLAEAAACAHVAGIDAQTFVDILGKGGGGGVALDRIKPYLLTGDPKSLQFSIANAHKDLGYYNGMAQASQVDNTIASAVNRTLELAVQAGSGESLMPEMVKIIAARSPH